MKPELSDQPLLTLDVERSKQSLDLPSIVHELRVRTGGSTSFFSEWAKLSFGKNRMLVDEYLAMRLWDSKFCPRSSLKEFVGNRGMVRVWNTANFVPGARALTSNKIAAGAILEAYGLSVPPVLGLHALGTLPGSGRTSTAEALESFLVHDLSYPAFGKPLCGFQSLGSVSLESCDPPSGLLTRQDGKKVEARALAQEIHARYAKDGYIFQPRLIPHEAVRAICGERTATVRILTILEPQGPRIFRAAWKIPAGSNWADNFWRPGNLLASIRLDDGVVQHVVSGSGLAMSEVDNHPDTKAPIVGTKVPLWEELCKAALAGAAAMPELGLLGWDIAATSTGPVIVEVNDTPDAIMPQIAARQGILDPYFEKFLEGRRSAEVVWRANLRASNKRELGTSFSLFSSADK